MRTIAAVFLSGSIIALFATPTQAQISNGQNAIGFMGQPNFTSNVADRLDGYGFSAPHGIVVDGVSGKVFVADRDNNRVLRFSINAVLISGSGAEAVLGQPDLYTNTAATTQSKMWNPTGVAMDGNGNLYVADGANNRVLKFADAATKSNGANADVVLGQTLFTASNIATTQSGMSTPTGIAIDGNGNLYVADYDNNRVLKFSNAAAKTNGSNADVVFGQTLFTTNTAATTQNGMRKPISVAVEGNGNLYVAEESNHRVLKFANAATLTNGANADVVLGQSLFTTNTQARTQNGMGNPSGVAIDGNGNLYVTEFNNRVLKFANAATLTSGANADGVLGQVSFFGNTQTATQSGMKISSGGAVDGSGNLYIADRDNNRVLKFVDAASKANGANADVVLGQTIFTAGVVNKLDSLGFSTPMGIAVDSVTQKVFVADQSNNRVLRFSSAATYTSGEGAEAVLGQPNFYTNASSSTQSGMSLPSGVAMDGNGNLYVADYLNNRVLKFAGAATLTSGANANVVFGQSLFTTNQQGTTQNTMTGPRSVAVDGNGNLFVLDGGNSRVLKFANAATKANGANADAVLGQTLFTTNSIATSQNGMWNPYSVAVDKNGSLYVADYGNNRVLKFANAAAKANGANADVVLGQTLFTTNIQVTTQSGMRSPTGVSVDSIGNLYVADRNNYRVLVFTDADTKVNGANANFVFGQVNFTSATSAATQSGMNLPLGIAVNNEAGILYVTDGGNHRVLIFDIAAILPVELVSFSASVKQNRVELQWNTATEIDNYGFEVERKQVQPNPPLQGEGGFNKVGFVEGNGTTNAPKEYSFTDDNVPSGNYFYRLKQIDRDGKFEYSHEVEITVGSAPKEFSLSQNYPNPFNPTTTISFTLQVSGLTTLKIYDTIGREVTTLINEKLEAGVVHQKIFSAQNLGSGIYFARLHSGSKSQMKKLILLR